ncbi:MAG: hypothetical protein AAF481_06175 [Acidobacteriota bacterium]
MDSSLAEGLRARLDSLLPEAVAKVVLTDNKSRLLTVRSEPASGGATAPALSIRAHRVFAEAPDEVVEQLARLCMPHAQRRAALAAVRDYFEAQRDARRVRSSPARTPPITTQGAVWDLRLLFDHLNEHHFDPPITAEVTWGRRQGRRRRQKSLRLGSYDADSHLIRIHPALDSRRVPRFVLATVIHHEMLHAVYPPISRPGRRRIIHGAEFRRRERAYPDFERTEAWLAKHLFRLC